MSRKSVIKHELDLADLPPLSEKQKAELAALAGRRDKDIDYSDIPPLTAEFWKNAERGKFYKPTKTSTTVRIDSDVLALVALAGQGLPVAYQCDPATRNAGHVGGARLCAW